MWAFVNSILSDFFIYPNLFKEEIIFSFITREFGISPRLSPRAWIFDSCYSFTAWLTAVFTVLDFLLLLFLHGLAHGCLHGLGFFDCCYSSTAWLTVVFMVLDFWLLLFLHGLAHGYLHGLGFLISAIPPRPGPRLSSQAWIFDCWFFLHGLAYDLPSRAWILIVGFSHGLSSRDHSAWSSPGLHRSAWITPSGLLFSFSTAVCRFYLCVILHGIYGDLFSA